ncbi:DUF192 domain-containing protein [Candidatus Woesebacteria bacterium]|nr:DUF192 domain-containing protein [Candidatus Woesebacteria bacterium]
MKQLIFLFLGVAIFIIAVGVYSKTPIPQKNTPDNKPLTKKEVTIGTTKVSVEIADDETERKKGLGGRESIGQNEGMLFVFPQKTSSLVFWMKEMGFPIDIIWIDENKIVKIDKNVQPEPGVSDNNLKRYYPETPVNFVLEVNGGFADKNKINLGDTVQIPPTP